MARKGNRQKNGLDRSTASDKKGGLQPGSGTPNRKGKGSVENMKDVKREELSSDTQLRISVTESLHKQDHVKDEKKRTSKFGKQIKVEIQGTTRTSVVEQSEPRDSTSEDCSANMSATGSSCLEEEKWASANGSSGSKNRKSSSGHTLNGFDRDGLRESVELPEALGVRYLKTLVLSVSQVSTEWLGRHKPLIDILVTKTQTIYLCLLGVESGQDGVIRSLLYERAKEKVIPYEMTVAEFTNKISGLRNKLGKNGVKDEGLVVSADDGAEKRIEGNVLAVDEDSLAYGRTPQERLRIMYGSGAEDVPGGFYPNGGDGAIAKGYLKRGR